MCKDEGITYHENTFLGGNIEMIKHLYKVAMDSRSNGKQDFF